MRNCPNCNKEVSEHSIICRYCGHFLYSDRNKTSNSSNTVSGDKTCPFCDEKIPISSIVCRYCGKAVAEPEYSKETKPKKSSFSPPLNTVQKEVKPSRPKALTAFYASLWLSAMALGGASMNRDPNLIFGISGFINNLVYSFLFSLVIYWILGLIILAIKPQLKVRGVVLVVFVGLLAIYFGSLLLPLLGNNSTTKPQSIITPTSFYPTRTQKPYTTPTSSVNINGIDCVEWRNVSKNDRNRKICVYGNVRSTSYSENIRANVITFSASPTAFYFILYGDTWFPTISDQCVKGYGTVYTVYDTPYIEIDVNSFFFCE